MRWFHVATALLAAPLLIGPAGATRPNIVLLMADDMGYCDIGCYGGEIETPHLDRLAAGRLRFTQFYNAARCCPTRAALLTGLYPHRAGVGQMVRNRPSVEPHPNQGYLNRRCVTIAEVLRTAGYDCYMSGKWHVGEFRPAWPIDRGFHRYYGLISGAMNYFDITQSKRRGLERVFARDAERVTLAKKGFYATDAFTDEALTMLRAHAANRPFFLYLAFNAPHWPLHAPPETIRKYENRYADGWSVLRRQRYQRMRQMGLVRDSWKLSPADGEDWDRLSDLQRQDLARRMAVYAAMVDRMDWNIGRLVSSLREAGQLDNTLILFLSDNGGCHEGGPRGGNMRTDLKGPTGAVDSYRTYGRSWSNVSNTPFRRHKHWAHEGGIATPLIAHWPARQRTAPGALTDEVGHVIDILPTLCAASGAAYPSHFAGEMIRPHEGRSLLPVFAGQRIGQPRTLFWEHMGNAAMRRDRVGDCTISWRIAVNSTIWQTRIPRVWSGCKRIGRPGPFG